MNVIQGMILYSVGYSASFKFVLSAILFVFDHFSYVEVRPRGYKTFSMLKLSMKFEIPISIKISRNLAFLGSENPRLVFFPARKC